MKAAPLHPSPLYQPETLLEPAVFNKGPNTKVILAAYAAALGHALDLKQSGELLGTLLLEKKKALGHGLFEKWRTSYFPSVEERTLRRYQQRAAQILDALPPPAIDIEVSVILLSAEEKLSPAALEYKQAWFGFNKDRNLSTIAAGAMLTVERATNGKTTGGFPVKGKERYAVERYIPVHLGKICSMLTVTDRNSGKVAGFKKLSADQRQAVCVAFAQTLEKLPNYVLLAIRDKSAAELKIGESERLARHAL